METEMLKRMRRNPTNAHATRRRESGFSLLQLLVVLATITIVSTFAVVGIGRARSAMRLSASERELAGYLEQARTDSIRRHASSPVNAGDPDLRATISVPANGGSTYTVTMDFDKDGVLDAPRTITLQDGVTFSGNAHTITFDWRGRTSGEVSIGLINELGSTSNINITGSGDITLNTEVFQDQDIPSITLNNNSVSGDVIVDSPPDGYNSETTTPTPTPTSGATPTPTPGGTTNPTPTPTPSGGTSTPTPTPTPIVTINPTPVPTPTIQATPVPTPTPVLCSISVSPNSLSLPENGGGTISVTVNNLIGTGTVSASSSNSGQLQVSPSSRSVSTGGGTVTFGITVKKQDASVTITTSPSCGSQTVPVTVN
jgi:Tfp pilus assembly protein FimT